MNQVFDDVRNDIDGVQSLLGAIGDALYYGPKDAGPYISGIYLLTKILDKDRELIDGQAFRDGLDPETTGQNPEWLKNLRISKQMTQAEVAEQCGIATNHYCNIENGVRRPSPEVAQKLAGILGFSWERFYLPEGERAS